VEDDIEVNVVGNEVSLLKDGEMAFSAGIYRYHQIVIHSWYSWPYDERRSHGPGL
jgi:hypothetical protein